MMEDPMTKTPDQSDGETKNLKDQKKTQAAADHYAELANCLQDEGLIEEADFGFKAAASIDLSNSSIQACWGGPFNGQTARRDLIKHIIQAWNPEAIVETGTFRGITTEWFAENTSRPIFTCEKNKRFFFQSEQRFSQFSNIHLSLQDSRDFLRQIAKTDISQKRVLFYLDAHWNTDLPLREEVFIIFNHFKSPCVIIDDFKVPFDAGYSYDDYGSGKVLSLEILEGLLSPDTQIAFPSTPSESDTGARRGTVILIHKELVDIFKRTNLVRMADYRDWRLIELEKLISNQFSKISELTKDSAARCEQIETLSRQLIESEADRVARCEQIESLTRQLTNYNVVSKSIEKIFAKFRRW